MQVGSLEVDNAISDAVLQVRILDVPFSGYGPIKDLRAARDSLNFDREMFPNNAKGLAHAHAGDTATDRI